MKNTMAVVAIFGAIGCGAVENNGTDATSDNPDAAETADARDEIIDAARTCSPLIAYVRSDGLFVVNADGTGVTSVVSSGSERSPVWSPDGSRLLFERTVDGAADIFSVRVDGSELVNLTNAPGDDTRPLWSPDGTRIAFVTEREYSGSGSDVFIMNGDGSAARRLGEKASSATWSPDGTRVAFDSYLSGRNQIYVVNIDGNPNLTNLTNSTGSDYAPSWSPDGAHIVFSSLRGSNSSNLAYFMNSDGSQQHSLVPSLGDTSTPIWSPDGSRLALLADGLYLVDPDGANLRNLTPGGSDGEQNREPAWSPDGTRLAFIRADLGASPPTQELYRINSDGSGLLQLTASSDYAERTPAWSPCAP